MCFRDRPPPFSPGVTGMQTLVATTISSRLEELGQQPTGGHLARPARVGVGRVEEGDAALDGGPHDRLGPVLVEHPGPVAVVAEAHHPEAHPGHPQTGATEIHVLHGDLPKVTAPPDPTRRSGSDPTCPRGSG